MEKTIEERYGCDKCYCASCEDCDSFLLVKGATEQKAIDKKLILDAYCKRCQDMGGGYPCSHKCQEYFEFEKTLEE